MKTISLALGAILTLAPFTPSLFAKAELLPTDYAQKIKPTTIKVLLEDKQESLLLEVNGAYKVFCPHTNVLIFSGSSPKRAKITPKEQGLFWKEILPGTYGIRIVPSDKNATIFVNGIQYKGCLEIYDVGGTLRAINEVDVENYLRSCLTTSLTQAQEPELLNALTIVARTNAYSLVQKGELAPWHITAKEAGYNGCAITMQNLPLEKAISDTRHAILTFEGKPFSTCWTENSAGKTAAFSSIFKDNANTPKGVILAGMESERAKSGWSFQVPRSEFAKLAGFSSTSKISTFAEKESGKVYAIKIENDKNAKIVDFFTLQNYLGKTKLKSNDFTIEVLDQTVRIKGYGEGNGVGLCLHTADLMAKQGADAKRILSEFFGGTALEKLRTLKETP